MFGKSTYFGGGNIPEKELDKIKNISDKFMSITQMLIGDGFCDRAIVRLLKPCNICVILDDYNTHFIFTNKGVCGHSDIQHKDLRGKGSGDFEAAKKIVERDLNYENSFGFTIKTHILLNMSPSDEEVTPYVKEYIYSEILYSERMAGLVRITPVFSKRDFFLNKFSCFVLMPFTSDNYLNQIYDDYIKTTIKKCGMNCHRADDVISNDAIMEDIWKSINEAKLIIAELTGKNSNVFYELVLLIQLVKK